MGHQTFGQFTIDISTDLSVEMEQGLNAYMASLHGSIDNTEPVETLSGEPFCGCETCHTREILAYVVPRVLFAQDQGLARLVSVDVPPKCGVTILASGRRCTLPMSHMGDHSTKGKS
jgi:hypothetical protein